MSEKKEYYWSLVFESGWVQAGIWGLEEKNVHVYSLSSPLSWETDEDLLEAVNSALSSAISNFPEEEEEPSKTVFGVPPSWVSEGQIKKEYIEKMRLICSKLSLTPSGFVILSESIAHAFKLEDGAPLSAIIVGLGKGALDVTLFRLGNLVGTVEVGRSVSVVEDIIEGLARFASREHFPSRILLYDSKEGELEEVKQLLIKADWEGVSDRVKFLHTPQVEIVDAKKKLISVCLAGASEMGEVDKLILDEEEEPSDISPETSQEETGELANLDQTGRLGPEDVGFMLGEDVKNMSDEPEESENLQESTTIKKSKFRVLGFMSKLKSVRLPFIKKGFSIRRPSVRRPSVKAPLVRGPSLPVSGISRGTSFKKVFLIVVLVVGVTLAAISLSWWFLPKADVAIYVSPRKIEEVVEVTLDEGTSSFDQEKLIVPAEALSVEVEGEKTKSTTGSKVVGEKAKGKVTIRNGTAVGIKVPAGANLIGPNDLRFTLSEQASVSAAVSPTSPGNLSADVSAENIGAEYNLAKGEVLTVGNYPKSEVDALVESDFTGGSSREIVAVSPDDLSSLEESLTKELEEQGKEKISGEVSAGKIFVKEALESKVEEKDFDHKEGDEASTVKLNLKLKVTGLLISKDSLDEISKKALESQVPEGFVLRKEQVDTQFILEGEEEGVWNFKLIFNANLLPEANPNEIARQISGRTPAQAKEYLSKIPGYSKAEIKLRPPFPGKLGRIPYVKQHISIELVAEK